MMDIGPLRRFLFRLLGEGRKVVRYEDFPEDVKEVLAELAERLEIPPPGDREAYGTYAYVLTRPIKAATINHVAGSSIDLEGLKEAIVHFQHVEPANTDKVNVLVPLPRDSQLKNIYAGYDLWGRGVGDLFMAHRALREAVEEHVGENKRPPFMVLLKGVFLKRGDHLEVNESPASPEGYTPALLIQLHLQRPLETYREQVHDFLPKVIWRSLFYIRNRERLRP